MKAKLIASLILFGFLLIFILQNTAVVEIQFLFWSLSMSRSLLVLVLVAFGMIIGWLLSNTVTLLSRRG